MKKLMYTLLLMLCFWHLKAQEIPDIPSQNGAIVYQDVVKVDSASKTDLKDRCSIWFLNYYNDSRAVIRHNGEDEIIGVGRWYYLGPAMDAFSEPKKIGGEYRITIEFKEGRYRYTVDNFDNMYPLGKDLEQIDKDIQEEFKRDMVIFTGKKARKKAMYRKLAHYKKFNTEIKWMLYSLYKAMRNLPQETKKDDW